MTVKALHEKMKFCCGIFLTLAALLRAVLTQSVVEYCVRSSQLALEAAFDGGSSVHRVSVEPQCTENMTWNEYLAKQDYYFKSNVKFYFLPGVHFMNQSLSVRDVSNMSFFGSGSSSVTLATNIPDIYRFLTNHRKWTQISSFGCAYNHFLGFTSGTNVILMDTEFQSTCEGCNIVADNLKNIAITSTLVQGGGFCFKIVWGNIEIKMSRFVTSSNSSMQPTFIDFSPVEIDNASVLIESCNFCVHL